MSTKSWAQGQATHSVCVNEYDTRGTVSSSEHPRVMLGLVCDACVTTTKDMLIHV